MATFVLFCLCIAILIFYHLFFHLKVLLFKDKARSGLKKPVSVIIIANNEYDNLQRLIPYLLKQEYNEFEVVLVDDRSYDETYEFYLSYSKQDPKLKFLHIDQTPETASAKKFAITLAIKAAKYDHLLFIDADCMPASEYWIFEMATHFAEKKEVLLGISPYRAEKTFLNKMIQFETGFTAANYLSFALAKIPYMGVGRNLGYAKHLFLDQKGFHPFYNVKGGDDDLFIQKIATSKNTSICISAESLTFSKPKTNFTDWYEQKKRHYSVSKYYTKRSSFLLGLFHTAHLFSYVLFIYLLFSQEFRLYSSVIFFVRLLLFWIIASMLFKKLAAKVEWYLVPGLELTYCLSVISFGLIGLKAKKIKWK